MHEIGGGFDYRILPTKDGVALPQLTLVDRWMSIRQTKAEALRTG